MTKSQTMAADIAALIRARNPLLWIVTKEEARTEGYLIEAAASAGYAPLFWDCAAGVTDASGRRAPLGSNDASETIEAIRAQATDGNDRRVWIMRDLAPDWLTGPVGTQTKRAIRNFCRNPGRGQSAQTIVVLTPSGEVPAELTGHATVIDWPLPDREEIAALLDIAVRNGGDKIAAPTNGTRDAAVDAAIGLSGEEAESCYARSLVQLRKIDPALVSAEKRRVIARERVLEWMPPLEGGFDAVGGLDVIKEWVTTRKVAYGPRARAYGLSMPKGIFLVGVSGCGKTFIGKAIAWALGQLPLLRYDAGALKSKYVGESEQLTRKAFRTIEAVGPCVVIIDEIEKALAGATQGAADGGVSADALGALLTWMQERTSPAFIVATANDVSNLPPELLRKGRWDELFFVDLPNRIERVQVLSATLQTHKRYPAEINLGMVADTTEGFSGAEIASLVPEAMFSAFADGERELATADLIKAAESVVPLSKTSAEKLNALRAWSKGRTRPATTPTAQGPQGTGRALDLG
jgi:ATP-dependent 26S proteasome regulatory subunit